MKITKHPPPLSKIGMAAKLSDLFMMSHGASPKIKPGLPCHAALQHHEKPMVQQVSVCAK
jgi:hypothetical protein